MELKTVYKVKDHFEDKISFCKNPESVGQYIEEILMCYTHGDELTFDIEILELTEKEINSYQEDE